jgi:hypothetical protein
MNANIRNIGGAIGTALVSSVITSGLQPGGVPREAGYRHGFLLLTAFSAVAVAVALLVPGERSGERRWLRAPATAEAR